MTDFTDEIGSIATNCPYPIAAICSKYRRIDRDNLNDRHALLGDIFETIVKFIAIVALQEGVQIGKGVNEQFPKGFEFLRHPSLGHWVSIIRGFGSLSWDDRQCWLARISDWYRGEKATPDIREHFKAIDASLPRGPSAVAAVMDGLVTYRNKVWKGHGAALRDAETLNKRLPALESLLLYLLQTARFLGEMNLFYVKEARRLDETNFEAISTSLVGPDEASQKFKYTDFMPQEIYLAYENKSELERKPIVLSPLVEWRPNEKGEEQFYFFNDVKRSKLEYLCYVDSSWYYHKEIRRELEQLFKVSLKKSSEDEEYILYNVDEDDRKERSRRFFNDGLEQMGRENWESAVILFEDALEWYRQPDIIVQMCEALLHLSEEREYVLANLEHAFELDSDYLPALQLRDRILRGEGAERAEQTALVPGTEADKGEYRTYFDLPIPARARNIAPLIWTVTLAGIFGGSAFALHALDPQNSADHVTASVLCLLETIILVGLYYSAKHKFLDSYFVLLGQLERMPVDRFYPWFKRSYKKQFGDFDVISDVSAQVSYGEGESEIEPRIRLNYKTEKKFLLLLGAWVLAWSVSAITIQRLYEYSLLTAMIRFIDSTILWIVMAPLIRYVVMSTLFIKEYSNLDLSPVITKGKNNGFHKMSSLFMRGVLVLNVFWIINWAWNAVVVRDPFYLDFVGLAFGLVVVLFWLVFTPSYIQRALQLSKGTAVTAYEGHVQQAFKDFLKVPDDNSLAKLKWLKENEGQVAAVSSRLLSAWNWAQLALTFLVVIVIGLVYVLIRLELLNESYETIKRLLQ
jgi:hypothetical protein